LGAYKRGFVLNDITTPKIARSIVINLVFLNMSQIQKAIAPGMTRFPPIRPRRLDFEVSQKPPAAMMFAIAAGA